MDLRLPPVEHADAFRLNAAQGWLELGDTASADDELDAVSPETRAHPAVLLIRCQIYFKAKKWDAAAEVSETLTQLFPGLPEPWINFAYATRRKTGGSVGQAKEILLKAEPQFSTQFIFPFNLACYCSQLGQLDETEQWLAKALAIDDKTVQKMAREDDDLKSFRDSHNSEIARLLKENPQS
ncbi:MAG TPA: hypothetical protein VFV23_08060 [Verrucomicrobiae bacterium]|nr:hypothetical protein [Verrucomicrobiae bacterium]